MKKILFILFCLVAFIGASAQTGKVSVNAGFLFPSTLNATLGYEYPLSYGNAVEVYGEVGKSLAETCMSQFLERIFLGWRYGLQAPSGTVQERHDAPSSGATVRCGTERKFFFGLEAGFEYSYVFRSGLEFSVNNPEEQCELPAWGYLPQRSAAGDKGSI